MTKFYSTKTYDHSEGLSCSFRQWRATSHCARIHGYALNIKFIFACESLDDCNWVVDFGGLKHVKAWLKDMFDHTCCVAEDDPELDMFREMNKRNLIDLRIVENTGCEGFSQQIFNYVNPIISDMTNNRCWIHSVEVREHAGNSAIVEHNGYFN